MYWITFWKGRFQSRSYQSCSKRVERSLQGLIKRTALQYFVPWLSGDSQCCLQNPQIAQKVGWSLLISSCKKSVPGRQKQMQGHTVYKEQSLLLTAGICRESWVSAEQGKIFCFFWYYRELYWWAGMWGRSRMDPTHLVYSLLLSIENTEKNKVIPLLGRVHTVWSSVIYPTLCDKLYVHLNLYISPPPGRYFKDYKKSEDQMY